MFNHPKTQVEAKAYRYNAWAGNPEGTPWCPDRCAMEVYGAGVSRRFYQCSRKPGKGPDSLYCAQHAKRVS